MSCKIEIQNRFCVFLHWCIWIYIYQSSRILVERGDVEESLTEEKRPESDSDDESADVIIHPKLTTTRKSLEMLDEVQLFVDCQNSIELSNLLGKVMKSVEKSIASTTDKRKLYSLLMRTLSNYSRRY